MVVPIFRFAPSPNGRLHLGHAYSALLNQRMARQAGGRLLLRIEDTDQTRCRPEFVTGIFEDLRWLGFSWEEPVRIQSEHFEDYEANLKMLWDKGAIYPCFCSRKRAASNALLSLDPDGQPHYGRTCRALSRDIAKELIDAGAIHAWRIDMQTPVRNPIGAPVSAEIRATASVWGDVVIAKRGVGSSYHIAVVTDDSLQGVTDVVRGRDMEAATSLHRLLQELLAVPGPRYLHHDLIYDTDGQKLSKRLKSTSLEALRAAGVTADDIRHRLGFE